MIYLVPVSFRSAVFYTGLRKKKKLTKPVISVGNITLGGTGKTPVCAFLARELMLAGKRAAVLSRGYGRKTRGMLIVSDGDKILAGVQEAGDEPSWMARHLPGLIVIAGKNRFKTGAIAIEKFGTDIVILDDGFQRRDALARNLEIVVVNAGDPFGNRRLFPAGNLREPLKCLKYADVFILTHCDEAETGELKRELAEKNPGVLIVETRHKPCRLILAKTGQNLGLEFLRDKRIVALSSIGNPCSFEHNLEKLGCRTVERVRYPDHYAYSISDMEMIQTIADEAEAGVVTTEKDMVRLQGNPEWLVLGVEIEILAGAEEFKKKIWSSII